jgi:glutathione S-transferase
MHPVRLLGLRISVYTRIARLALAEKKVDYELGEVDIFADEGPPEDYLALHPFGRIPCLLYGDFCLYETSAICRYIDEGFVGPELQPASPAMRARMTQIVSALDNYGYRPMVWDVYVQREVIPAGGGQADEDLISSALPEIEILLRQLDEWLGAGDFLVGDAITLADLHAYPMLRYFIETAEGAAMLAAFPRLSGWMARMQSRPSSRTTSFHSAMANETGF